MSGTHLIKLHTTDDIRIHLFNNSTIVGDCWLWTGSTANGYGHLYIRGEHRYAHHLSYIVFIGKIKKGLWVLHKCDNPQCINPKHLFLGTPSDNTRDSVFKGRWGRREGWPMWRIETEEWEIEHRKTNPLGEKRRA